MADDRNVDVIDLKGKKAGSVVLPGSIFDVPTNIPLMHQVVVAQLAAPVRARTRRRPAVRSLAAARSRSVRRAPVTLVRALSVRLTSPAVASSTALSRVTTTSAPPRR